MIGKNEEPRYNRDPKDFAEGKEENLSEYEKGRRLAMIEMFKAQPLKERSKIGFPNLVQPFKEFHKKQIAQAAQEAGEKTGGNVNYYVVDILEPKRLKPYVAECEDIIEALKMNFAEGCAFKAIWRSCAARTLGKLKAGGDAVYDAEKVVYYGQRMVEQRKKESK